MPDAPQTRGQRIAAALEAARSALDVIERLAGTTMQAFAAKGLEKFPDHDAIGAVVDALEKYGDHYPHCPAEDHEDQSRCDCGLTEALAALASLDEEHQLGKSDRLPADGSIADLKDPG